MKNHFIKKAITLAFLLINLFIHALPTAIAADLQYRKKEKDMTEPTLKTIYFAGGCFWGIEKLFNSINGVIKAESGYANGNADIIPKYEKVIQGDTGFKETVKVDYAPATVNLEQLLAAFFLVIDPTVKNRQANDIGTQYQTGIYYTEENSKQRIEEYIKHEKAKYSIFVVEVEQLQNFYPAEDYHQNYLNKNPHGYCHINPQIFKSINEKISLIKNNTTKFHKKTQQQLKKELTPLQFEVTQNAATERAFSGDYWNFF